MGISRRDFLALLGGAVTAVALPACARLPRPRTSARARYYVPSPELYWHERQDFSPFASARSLTAPGTPASARSLLTVAGENGELARAFVPGLIHSALASRDRVFLVTVDTPTTLYSVASDAGGILAVAAPPAGGHIFGGHLIAYGPNHLLVTLNSPEAGRYDSVGVFHRETLREEARFSTQGFQAHDLALSPKGHLFVGHYGSYLGSGPYHRESFTTQNDPRPRHAREPGAYPSCVSVLDPASGKVLERFASAQPGPLGHLTVSGAEEIFITAVEPRLALRKEGCAHRAFAEGPRHRGDYRAFAPTLYNSGTSILNDEAHGEVLVTQRSQGKLLCTPHAPGSATTEIDLKALDPAFGLANGLRTHGDHILVSTNRGFLVFDRGTHRYRAELSFAADLKIHSHFDVLAQG